MSIPQEVIDYVNDNSLKSTMLVINDGSESFDSYYIDKNKNIERVGKYKPSAGRSVATVDDLAALTGIKDGSVIEVLATRPNITEYKFINGYSDGEVIATDNSGSWIELNIRGLRPKAPPPKWVKKHGYLANETFTFRPTQNDPIDIDGQHLSNTITYVGHYLEDTYSAKSLKLTEIAKIKTEPYLPNTFEAERIHVFGTAGKTTLVESGVTVKGTDTDTLTLGRASGHTSIKSSASVMTIDATSNGALALNQNAGGKLVLGKNGRVTIGAYPNDANKFKVFGRANVESLSVGNGTYPIDGLDDFTITSEAEKASIRLLTQDSSNTTTDGGCITLNDSANGGSLDINNYEGCTKLQHIGDTRVSVCNTTTFTPASGYSAITVARVSGKPSITGNDKTDWLILEGGAKNPLKRKIGLGYYNDTDVFMGRNGGTTVIGAPSSVVDNHGKLQVNGMIKSKGNMIPTPVSNFIDVVVQKRVGGSGATCIKLPKDDSKSSFSFSFDVHIFGDTKHGVYSFVGLISKNIFQFTYKHIGHSYVDKVFAIKKADDYRYLVFGDFTDGNLTVNVSVMNIKLFGTPDKSLLDNNEIDIVKLTAKPDGFRALNETKRGYDSIRLSHKNGTVMHDPISFFINATKTGYMTIPMPDSVSPLNGSRYGMLIITIVGRSYNSTVFSDSWEVTVAGYMYTNGFIGANIQVTGETPFGSKVGIENIDNKLAIVLGNEDTIWKSPGVFVKDIRANHNLRYSELSINREIKIHNDAPTLISNLNPVFKYESSNRLLINTRQNNTIIPYGGVSYINGYLKWDKHIRVHSGTKYHYIGPKNAYTDIILPANNTIIPVNGTNQTRTVNQHGITLLPNESLYYKIDDGSDILSDDSNFVITSSTKYAELNDIRYIKLATVFDNEFIMVGNDKFKGGVYTSNLINTNIETTDSIIVGSDSTSLIFELTSELYNSRNITLSLDLVLSQLETPKSIYLNVDVTHNDVVYNLGNDGSNSLPITTDIINFKKNITFDIFSMCGITDFSGIFKIQISALSDGGDIELNNGTNTVNETKNGLNANGTVVGNLFTASSMFSIKEELK